MHITPNPETETGFPYPVERVIRVLNSIRKQKLRLLHWDDIAKISRQFLLPRNCQNIRFFSQKFRKGARTQVDRTQTVQQPRTKGNEGLTGTCRSLRSFPLRRERREARRTTEAAMKMRGGRENDGAPENVYWTNAARESKSTGCSYH